jgi:formylglycine-generating enzyme required for sulfatase activity
VVSTSNAIGTYTEAVGNATRAFYRLVPAFTPDALVFVQGNGTIPDLMVSNTETTWSEWKRVRNWALGNGYDLANIGEGWGNNDRQPVQSVSWFDVLKWCNARSEMEGRTPVYTVNGATYKTGNQTVVWNMLANGYRLPTEVEWEWAAKGGNSSLGYIFSGSNTVGTVAWYVDNAGGSPKPVATKTANELGLHDMSGNVFEWCWDEIFGKRGVRGGSWAATEQQCQISFGYEQFGDTRSPDIGFRVVRLP